MKLIFSFKFRQFPLAKSKYTGVSFCNLFGKMRFYFSINTPFCPFTRTEILGKSGAFIRCAKIAVSSRSLIFTEIQRLRAIQDSVLVTVDMMIEACIMNEKDRGSK